MHIAADDLDNGISPQVWAIRIGSHNDAATCCFQEHLSIGSVSLAQFGTLLRSSQRRQYSLRLHPPAIAIAIGEGFLYYSQGE